MYSSIRRGESALAGFELSCSSCWLVYWLVRYYRRMPCRFFSRQVFPCVTNPDPSCTFVCRLSFRVSGLEAESQGRFGHFGLGLSHYTHFTSPIRRYADIVVHRLLLASLGISTSTAVRHCCAVCWRLGVVLSIRRCLCRVQEENHEPVRRAVVCSPHAECV